MKKSLIFIAMLLVSFTMAAQDGKKEDMKEKFFQAKVKEMVYRLDITDEQKPEFVKVYRAYTDAMREAFASYWGTDLADQTDDLYLSVALSDSGESVVLSQVDDSSMPQQIFSPDGICLGSDLNGLPRGLYILRRGSSSNKVVVR